MTTGTARPQQAERNLPAKSASRDEPTLVPDVVDRSARPAVAGLACAPTARTTKPNRSIREGLARALDVAVAHALTRPMRWGEDDCALWCANVLRGVLGFDPAARFRARYTTARGYRRVLRREGLASLEDAIDRVARACGWPRIDPAQAETGDLGIVELAAGRSTQATRRARWPALACVIKRGPLWVGRRNLGVGHLPTEQVIRAWSVIPHA